MSKIKSTVALLAGALFARACGHLMDPPCSQKAKCVHILSFGKKTGCQDCCCETTSGCELKDFSKASPETVVGQARTIACLLKRCSGWHGQARRGAIFRSLSGPGIPRSAVSRAGPTKAYGKPSSPDCPKTLISKRCFWTARLFVRTSTRQGLQKKGTTRYWPFSWGLEHQDSCGRRWAWQSGAIPSLWRRAP